MKKFTYPSLKSIQNRQILNLMGVSLWINKHAKNNTINISSDKNNVGNDRIRHLLHNNKQNSIYSDVDVNHKNKMKDLDVKDSSHETIIDISRLVAKKDNHGNDKILPSIQPKVLTHTPKVSFYLQGLRYNNWVLVVNILTMNDDERALWQSLKNALMQELHKKSESLTENIIYREIHYPLVDDEFYASMGLNPAQYTFDGFIIGLSVPIMEKSVVLMAFLNDMPNEIAIPPSQTLPSINDMIINPYLKKDFWQKVVG